MRLYYAAAVSLFGALASRLVASSLLPWNDGGLGLFWCGAVALAPLVLYGWRALPAAVILAVAVEAISRNGAAGSLIAASGDVVEAVLAYAVMARFAPFDPRFRTRTTCSASCCSASSSFPRSPASSASWWWDHTRIFTPWPSGSAGPPPMRPPC